MSFTGKSTFGAGAGLPELMEDVSDIVGIVSPHETPLLALLGDAKAGATSTIHEWIEDALLPNTDALDQSSFSPSATAATSLTVEHGSRFQVGDQVRPGTFGEVMFVTAVSGNTLTVARGYGGTTPGALADGMALTILGNAALEGDDAPAARFTSRVRKQNYTQIFAASVSVSGSMQAARAVGVADEADYQRQERLRELLRDLENCVINGVAPAATPQGSASVRRTMNGLISLIQTNALEPDTGGIPAGGGVGGNELTEPLLNACLRRVWEQSSGKVDTILVNGFQKRKINEFVSSSRRFSAGDDRLRDMLSVYESDFGVCRVVMSRWVPADRLLLLDSSRLAVPALAGRSFAYKPLGATGDSVRGMLVGEYTLECRNENAHAVLSGLATA
jgi:hypothetical protein